jgi:hypothetical protein
VREEVRVNVYVDPSEALAGVPLVAIFRTGAGVMSTDTERFTGAAASDVSLILALIVSVPEAVAPTSTVAVIECRRVPAVIGRPLVAVQVKVLFALVRAQFQPVTTGAEANVSFVGSVTFTTGSWYAGPPVAVSDVVTFKGKVEPAEAFVG